MRNMTNSDGANKHTNLQGRRQEVSCIFVQYMQQFLQQVFNNLRYYNYTPEMLLQKITALAKVNQEIINRLKQRKGNLITGFTYTGTFNTAYNSFTYKRYDEEDPAFQLTEQPSVVNAEYFIRDFQMTIQLHTIEDIFNHNLNYNCQRFADLERLNRDMLRVALKYKLFGENAESTPYLRKFLENFEKIQVALGELETAVMDKQSIKETLQKRVDALNKEIKDLAQWITWSH
jgi:hypothetical protein